MIIFMIVLFILLVFMTLQAMSLHSENAHLADSLSEIRRFYTDKCMYCGGEGHLESSINVKGEIIETIDECSYCKGLGRI